MIKEPPVKQLLWETPNGRTQYTYDNEYVAKLPELDQWGNNLRIYRKEKCSAGTAWGPGAGKLIFQFFLTEAQYKKVHAHFGPGSWTWFDGSTIHFYGGNYIYCEWSPGFREICKILGIDIKWQ